MLVACRNRNSARSVSRSNRLPTSTSTEASGDGRATYCTPCNRSVSRQRYQQKRDYYSADALRRKKAMIEANIRRVCEYLETHPCLDCGEADLVVLDFDHQSEKVRAVSELVARGCGWPTILKEINKCDVRCATCHRRKTAAEQGWRVLDYKVA
jgi:hypothetical protein